MGQNGEGSESLNKLSWCGWCCMSIRREYRDKNRVIVPESLFIKGAKSPSCVLSQVECVFFAV